MLFSGRSALWHFQINFNSLWKPFLLEVLFDWDPHWVWLALWTIARFIYESGYAADTIDHHPVAMSLGNEFSVDTFEWSPIQVELRANRDLSKDGISRQSIWMWARVWIWLRAVTEGNRQWLNDQDQSDMTLSKIPNGEIYASLPYFNIAFVISNMLRMAGIAKLDYRRYLRRGQG